MRSDIKQQYKDFSEWCRDNPAFDLDPRLHTHSGRIEDGGYISHRTTSAAFAAWKAGRQGLEGESVGVIVHRTDPRSDNPDAYIDWTFGGDVENLPDGMKLYGGSKDA